MPPFFLRPRILLGVRQSSNDATAPAAAPGQRVVFILCIVFGSLLACVLAAIAFYFTRRYMHQRRLAKEQSLRRDASFLVGGPSFRASGPPLTTPARAKRARRPSARRTSPLPRMAIPSPELGSVFRLDSSLIRATIPLPPIHSPPVPEPAPAPKVTPPRHRHPLPNGSKPVSNPPFDKYDMPLRVINPVPLTPLNTNTTPPQKPNHIYRTSPSPSREHLVSTASADSLTSTPPLSPEATSHSRATFTLTTPMTTDVITHGASAMRKTLSVQDSVSSLASSAAARRVEKPEPSPYLTGLEYTPFVLPAVQEASPPLNRCRSADEVVNGAVGTPVTLSHFPFRFSNAGPRSPSLLPPGPSPVRSSHTGTRNPPTTTLDASGTQRRGLTHLDRKGSAWTLPHSTTSLKLKIKHVASDQIIAIAFVPHSITFRAVRDAVRARLGFRPQRVWSESTNTQITDDTTLWRWLEEQYTQGRTRLILQVE